MRILIISVLFALISFSALADESTAYTIAADQRNGMITVMQGSNRLLHFDYYDWGPEWSGVHRSNATNEENDQISFTYENTIARTNTEFTIQGFWKKTSPTQMRFEADLSPKANSTLTQAQFSLTAGELLQGDKARIYNRARQFRDINLPFSRGLIGDEVIRIEFIKDDNLIATLEFDTPTYISADRNEARIAIARENIQQGQTYELKMTLTLADALTFYPGPNSTPNSQDGWYEFSQNVVISPDSPLSMASWLDGPAGKYGRILSDGDTLYRNNQPTKLWGLNLSFSACAPNKELADKRAAFYAAMGVNSVRCHKYAQGPGWQGITSENSTVIYNPDELDKFDYFIAALKKKGIYTKLSPVFIISPGPDDIASIPYLNEFEKNNSGWYTPKHGSIYFSPELQNLLIQQFTNLLMHTNPYTGLTYAEDPAIVYVELYNEDSIFFHGTPRALATSPTLRANAGELFANWLKEKYQTERAWRNAWGDRAINASILRNQRIPTDENWNENRIYPIGNPWFFDPDNIDTSQSRYRQRLYDTMEFLYQHQNLVYAKIADAVKQTGYTGEIISSNWIAGRQMSHFYNLHSDYLIGTIDRHNYFGGGRGAFHANASMLASPGSGILSSGLHQVKDRPFMLSEWIHVSPNEWTVEGPAIIGAYGMGLQGWDASYAFQNGDHGSFSPSLRDQWDVTAPNFIGLFPAVSRQVHRQDIQMADLTHHLNVHVPSLAEGKVGFELRDQTSGDIKSTTTDVFDASALAIMRSQIRFTDEFTPTSKAAVESHTHNNQFNSTTEELSWTAGDNHQSGFFTIDTANTQAVVGFAQKLPQTLSNSHIELNSRFGAVYITAQSENGSLSDDDLLIIAIGRARNEGAAIVNDNFILSHGTRSGHHPTGPVMMEPVHATIKIDRDNLQVFALKHDGTLTDVEVPVNQDGVIVIDTGVYKTPYFLARMR
ncbi:hypothetical protein [Nitrincola schmidtii]|uniref:hypothetical protein n=1 Tax=Nitrincola schmidtii TaxID=1730894 RepID=UPI00124F230E|nr:hypothetical protein [Nitrincola schmidtii]